MSSPECKAPARILRGVAITACILAMAIGSACTVRPLYSTVTAADGTPTRGVAGLSSIDVKPVKTRYAQEVRNRLIFLLNGGAGQPAGAEYSLELGVTAINSSSVIIQTVREDRPTAGAVVMTSSYMLKKSGTGVTVARGTRQISSSYDRPRQEFAALRAIRDAENRAARELAELLNLAIAQDLARLQ